MVSGQVAITTALRIEELGSVRIIDFTPRFYWRDRSFRPQMIIRRLIPAGGRPRIRIRVKPRFEYGTIAPNLTFGSNHIRYAGPNTTIRLTTDAPIDYVVDETPFNLAHLRNMTAVTEMGGVIFPPLPAFYHRPQSVDELVNDTVERVLALIGVETAAPKPWSGL